MPEPLSRGLQWLVDAAGGTDTAAAVGLAIAGILVGLVAFSAAVAAAYWIRNTRVADGAGEASEALARRGLRGIRAARGEPERGPWLCARCRSWNKPGASRCYRGCGPRDDVRMLMPGDAARPPTGPLEPDPEVAKDDPEDAADAPGGPEDAPGGGTRA